MGKMDCNSNEKKTGKITVSIWEEKDYPTSLFFLRRSLHLPSGFGFTDVVTGNSLPRSPASQGLHGGSKV